jgi:hypothetical protein
VTLPIAHLVTRSGGAARVPMREIHAIPESQNPPHPSGVIAGLDPAIHLGWTRE